MEEISKREATGHLRREELCNTPEHCGDLICSQIDLRNCDYEYGTLPLHQRVAVTVPTLRSACRSVARGGFKVIGRLTLKRILKYTRDTHEDRGL